MAIDHSFIIKKLQGLPEMFVIFSQSTKHPYVTCNEESFDDQIHIFSDAEAAHAYVVAKNEQEKIPVVSVRVAAEQFLHFYGTLYALGVNGVVLHDNDTETSLALEAIVHRRHNPDELPEKQRPVINPELMLTSLYFLQEMRRPVSEEEKEKADLRAMDEELVANLVRGRFFTRFYFSDFLFIRYFRLYKCHKNDSTNPQSKCAVKRSHCRTVIIKPINLFGIYNYRASYKFAEFV